MDYFLTVNGDGALEIQAGGSHEVLATVRDEKGYADFFRNVRFEGHSVFCSSSLDFPREYTDDEGVIALCRRIRGNA